MQQTSLHLTCLHLTQMHWPCIRLGWAANMFYWGALVFYVYTRIRYTLSGLGHKYEFYGIVLLVIECLGATTILQYGTNLLFRSVHEKYPRDPDNPSKPLVSKPVPLSGPCLTESLSVFLKDAVHVSVTAESICQT